MYRCAKAAQNASISRGIYSLYKQRLPPIAPTTALCEVTCNRCLSSAPICRTQHGSLARLRLSQQYESRRHASGKPGGRFNLAVIGGILAAVVIGGALLFDMPFSGKSSSDDEKKDKKDKRATKKDKKRWGRQAEEEEEEEPIPVIEKKPLPASVAYLIIGAGTAAMTASKTIRKNDPTAKVLMVTEEGHRPYMRPPLSKELWFRGSDANKLMFKDWAGQMKDVFYEPEEYYLSSCCLEKAENGGTAVGYGRKVTKLDVVEQMATFADGDTIKYDKCLIATGGRPRALGVFSNLTGAARRKVHLYRNIEDFRRLHKATDRAMSVMVVGGGFLGSELAVALAQKAKERDLKVTQAFPEKGNMGLVFPEYLSLWSLEKVRSEGVTVYPETLVVGCEYNKETRKLDMTCNTGEKLSADEVVVAVGLEPNVALAESSGLELDPKHGGFLVNAELEARKNLWVAGDAACFYDINLGRRRVEHHDHAVVSGRLAGDNMTGEGKPYWHQSMFWSDLGPSIGYEAIGICDSSLPTFAVFAKATAEDTPQAFVKATGEGIRSETETEKTSTVSVSDIPVPHSPMLGEDYGKGVVFYTRDDKVVGMVLWNLFGRMPVARQVLKDSKPGQDLTDVAKLFDVYDQKKKEETTEKK